MSANCGADDDALAFEGISLLLHHLLPSRAIPLMIVVLPSQKPFAFDGALVSKLISC